MGDERGVCAMELRRDVCLDFGCDGNQQPFFTISVMVAEPGKEWEGWMRLFQRPARICVIEG